MGIGIRSRWAVAPLAMLLIAACGRSSDTSTATSTSVASAPVSSPLEAAAKLKGDDKKAYDGVVVAAAKLFASAPGGITSTQEACVGLGFLQTFGTKHTLELTGAESSTMSEGDAGRAADVFLACYDYGPTVASALKQRGTVTAAQADCIAGKIPNSAYRSSLTLSFDGKAKDAAASAAIADATKAAMAACS